MPLWRALSSSPVQQVPTGELPFSAVQAPSIPCPSFFVFNITQCGLPFPYVTSAPQRQCFPGANVPGTLYLQCPLLYEEGIAVNHSESSFLHPEYIPELQRIYPLLPLQCLRPPQHCWLDPQASKVFYQSWGMSQSCCQGVWMRWIKSRLLPSYSTRKRTFPLSVHPSKGYTTPCTERNSNLLAAVYVCLLSMGYLILERRAIEPPDSLSSRKPDLLHTPQWTLATHLKPMTHFILAPFHSSVFRNQRGWATTGHNFKSRSLKSW